MTQLAPARGPLGKFSGWLHGLFDSEMFSSRQILKMFYPLLLDQLAIHLIMVLTTSLVSSVSQEALAAVSMVGTLCYMITAIMFALGSGGGVIIAQAKGSGDEDRLRKAVATTTMLTSGSMLVLSVALYVLANPIISLLYPNLELVVKEHAVHYMKLCSLSLVPYAIFHAIFTAFRSVGDSKSALVLTLYINVGHLVLSLLFINVMDMGVTGSGLSLIAARLLGCVAAVVWVFMGKGMLHILPRDFFKVSREIVRPIIKLSVPFCAEILLFEGGMVVVQGYLSNWGATPADSTRALAAHAVALSIMNLYQASAFCITQMMSTVCGQCIGAGKLDLAKRYKESMNKGGRLVLLITVLILFPLTPLVLKLYNPNPDALRMIYFMLSVAVLPMPLIWCNAFATPGMLCSAGDVQYPTYISIISMVVGRVALGYVLTMVLNLGPVGIWLGQLVEWLIRVVLLEKRYKSEKWIYFINGMQKTENV